MKLGMAEREGRLSLLISAGLSDSFVSWKKIQDWAAREKLLQEVHTLSDFIQKSEGLLPWLLKKEAEWKELETLPSESIHWALPFRPYSFRDFYCFEEHVKKGREGRGLPMLDQWYEKPVFYYSNPLSFVGPGLVPYPRASEAMDFELEIACVLGRPLFNASLEEAHEAILGYSLLNDWTARDFQGWEMKLNLGPTKGKDFCSSLGSFLVTKESLEKFRSGKGYDLEFCLRLNSKEFCRANWKAIQFSFEEMLVRASQNCRLYPGELLGSGTMGGGCLMERNLSQESPSWLKPGDEVELSCETLGLKLLNRVVES
ncbi:MAG: fumarylacetoacetate hydrolase family protein [Bradymonadales bacterium]|nr:MAG: fumarylacetoacetate hydrolase family protein [Bradymonadales bacterium]